MADSGRIQGGSAGLQQIESEERLRLRDDEKTLLDEECSALIEQPLPDAARAAYSRLREAARDGEIAPEMQEWLQSLLEVGLESGRIRRLHGAHAEMAANRLYARLPRGGAYRASIEAANQAVAALAGQSITDIRFQPRGPGSCSLTLDAGGRRITLSIRRSGISVDSVEASV
ncbi:MAG TPA: hypothetical protein VFJ58_03465 [Armatimonadota bacterium]|nr:hypothetical protein [Armatimonadota bacterium]